MNNQKKNTLLEIQLDEVKHILQKHNDLSDTSTIELDLMKDKLRAVYDALCSTEQQPTTTTHPPPVHPTEKPGQQEDTADKTPVEFEEDIPDTNQEETTTAAPEAPVEEEEEIVSATEEEDENKKEEAPATVADRYKQNGQFMNESFAEKRQPQNDISNKIQNKPLDDLNKALGVNDRFQLTRDLFHGNRAKFTETIEALNSTNSYEEAENLIAENFQWDMQNPNVKLLMDLVKRKHS